MTLMTGDCLDLMPTLEPKSVDAVITDPPYDLTSTGARKGSPRNPGTGPYSRGFMGKAWDGTGIAFRAETWEAAYRLAKPSSYLLAFGGTRTVHRMTCAIEDAGWIVRDLLVWAYASGFPKSRASLKPAWEPIVMARKPGPLRMLNIDDARIAFQSPSDAAAAAAAAAAAIGFGTSPGPFVAGKPRDEYVAGIPTSAGRWPANVILTDPIFDGDVPGVVGGGEADGSKPCDWTAAAGRASFPVGREASVFYDDAGTYSRFFLIPKASRSDREPIWSEGVGALREGREGVGARRNVHPTVKPVDLMRHLVRLVTPSDGIVLDPFLGSGTTAIAAELEGFGWVGIEREPEYAAIAAHRLEGVQRGMGFPA